MIHAGELRHHVTFKAPTPTVDRGDTTLDPWYHDFETWVAIQWLGGTEPEIADQRMSVRVGILKMRWDDRATNRKRIVMHNEKPPRTLEVISCIDPDEGRRELQLTVRELV